MMTRSTSSIHVGLLGLEATGVTDRSVALDIAHAICLEAGFNIAFHLDLAFDDGAKVWNAVSRTAMLDAILICLRPTAALLLGNLQEALNSRLTAGLSDPLVAFGGPTVLCAYHEIAQNFSKAFVWSGTVEEGFPHFLKVLYKRFSHAMVTDESRRSMRTVTKHFAMPVQHSTERCVRYGGSIWIEASRGCHQKCNFCIMSNDQALSKWIPRPLEDLFDEIATIKDQFGVGYFSFSDLSAFETREYTQAFLDEYRRRNMTFSFRCDMRLATVRNLGNKLLELRDAGLSSVYVGIETLVPEFQLVYGKQYPGKEAIDHLLSIDILVSAGIIMLDPLYSPEDFRCQVEGVLRENLLPLIATPFKTTRVQKGTRYEILARNHGILGDLLPNLCDYSYRCLDQKMEIVRQIMEFFHQTTKHIYYNPYIEGQIRQARLNDNFVARLHGISVRYKEIQMKLLHHLARIVTENSSMDGILKKSLDAADMFAKERKEVFAVTAKNYEQLLVDGIPYYRLDLERFISLYQEVPMFDADRVRVAQ
ncbi:MAG: radical SAM protein [Magnetococcales bacterium]|nr:radical SAM protein [Magnetococcales bacterium]